MYEYINMTHIYDLPLIPNERLFFYLSPHARDRYVCIGTHMLIRACMYPEDTYA